MFAVHLKASLIKKKQQLDLCRLLHSCCVQIAEIVIKKRNTPCYALTLEMRNFMGLRIGMDLGKDYSESLTSEQLGSTNRITPLIFLT